MMKNKPTIKCKVTDGVRVCRISTPNGRTMKLSSAVGAPPSVSIKLYTSTDCHWCKEAEHKIRKTTNRLNDIVKIDIIDVDSDRFMREKETRVDMLPTIKIGNSTIVGIPDEDQVWQHIFNAYKGT